MEGLVDVVPLAASPSVARYRARHPAHGEPLALSVFTTEDDGFPERFERYVVAMQRLADDQRFVTLRGSGKSPTGNQYVLFDLGHSTLAEVLAEDGALPFEWACDTVAVVAGAVATAHDAGLVHGRIAPDRVVVGQDGGLSVRFDEAPGIDGATASEDVRALGLLLLEVLTGRRFSGDAFSGPDGVPLPYPPQAFAELRGSGAPEAICELIELCGDPDLARRPTAQALAGRLGAAVLNPASLDAPMASLAKVEVSADAGAETATSVPVVAEQDTVIVAELEADRSVDADATIVVDALPAPIETTGGTSSTDSSPGAVRFDPGDRHSHLTPTLLPDAKTDQGEIDSGVGDDDDVAGADGGSGGRSGADVATRPVGAGTAGQSDDNTVAFKSGTANEGVDVAAGFDSNGDRDGVGIVEIDDRPPAANKNPAPQKTDDTSPYDEVSQQTATHMVVPPPTESADVPGLERQPLAGGSEAGLFGSSSELRTLGSGHHGRVYGRPSVGGGAIRVLTIVVAILLGLAVLGWLVILLGGGGSDSASGVAAGEPLSPELEQEAGSQVRVQVPDIEGKVESEATSRLAIDGFEVVVTYELSVDTGDGEVIRQEPIAGERVDEGAEVRIVVSRNRDETEDDVDESANSRPQPLRTVQAPQPTEVEAEEPDPEPDLPVDDPVPPVPDPEPVPVPPVPDPDPDPDPEPEPPDPDPEPEPEPEPPAPDPDPEPEPPAPDPEPEPPAPDPDPEPVPDPDTSVAPGTGSAATPPSP